MPALGRREEEWGGGGIEGGVEWGRGVEGGVECCINLQIDSRYGRRRCYNRNMVNMYLSFWFVRFEGGLKAIQF